MKRFEIWWVDSEIIEAENESEAEEVLRKHRPAGACEWGIDPIDDDEDDEKEVE